MEWTKIKESDLPKDGRWFQVIRINHCDKYSTMQDDRPEIKEVRMARVDMSHTVSVNGGVTGNDYVFKINNRNDAEDMFYAMNAFTHWSELPQWNG